MTRDPDRIVEKCRRDSDEERACDRERKGRRAERREGLSYNVRR